MNFNDYQIPSEKEYNIMNQSFNNKLSSETIELQEILSKLREQKTAISRKNTDGKYNKILSTYDSNITELSRLISNKNKGYAQSSNYQIPSIPTELKLYSQQVDEIVPTPIRSNEEIAKMRSLENSINNNINNDFSPPTQVPITPINQTKRNRPMQSSIFASIFKKFPIKNNEIYDDGYRNKYHIIALNDCVSSQKIKTNQIDIIRLLLLYLTLNPTCRYCSRIASITCDQFEIYQNLK